MYIYINIYKYKIIANSIPLNNPQPPAQLYNIKKILLGTNASNIIAKVDSLGGTSVVRIRIRGMGSGYPEGPNRQVRSRARAK